MHYHNNAKTNINQRKFIKESNLSCRILANQFKVSPETISKWKKVDHLEDKNPDQKESIMRWMNTNRNSWFIVGKSAISVLMIWS